MNKIINTQELDNVVIRFAGDSGEGMQLMGGHFTNTAAVMGNDIHTFPDFPAEIRAPAGTVAGVSGFQLNFSKYEVHTPGDKLHVLIAMNPAALKANLSDLEDDGLLIVNSDTFNPKEFQKAAYAENPLENGALSRYRVFSIALNELTLNAVSAFGLSRSEALRCKNMFALGIIFWLYNRDLDHTLKLITQKFSGKTNILEANQTALKAGYNYALTTELFTSRYKVSKAKLPSGRYRQITGNEAFALACAVAAHQSQRPLLLSGYPITPASTILHYVAKYQHRNIKIFQAEDEIAAMSATVGAAFGGSLALTSTSGPGFDLKSEAMGLGAMAELPMVILDIQRAGPSTGLPTKTEQSDLLAAIHGRHGECPIPVLAPQSPGDCFNTLLEAFQIALKYMTPVIVLSDTLLAIGAEPWLLPDIENLPPLKPTFHTEKAGFSPYARDPETLARLWAIPGTPGLEHRIGGLEKANISGNVSYDPDNHHAMVLLRQEKITRIANDFSELKIYGPTKGKLLIIGWGSTYGHILTAVDELKQRGIIVSYIHLRHLFPFPNDLEKIISNFETVLVPELNLGQLASLLRQEFLIPTLSYNKICGKPFLTSELVEKIEELLIANNQSTKPKRS